MANAANDALRKGLQNNEPNSPKSDTLAKFLVSVDNSEESLMPTSLSYLMTDGSQNSRDVDRWINGDEATTPVNTAVQRSREPMVQRSTLATETSLNMSGLCYILALMMPLLRTNQNSIWRCSPSAVMNTLQPLFLHLGQICTRIHGQFRRFARDNIAREIFSTALDIIIVVYAIGFLFISLYEASLNV